MLHKLAENISFYLITNNIIDIEDRDTYIYGLELLISTLLIFISILLMGLLLGNFISAVVYLLVHVFLKSYTGGYHAKHYYECYIYSICNYIILIFINSIILERYKPFVGFILLVNSILIIFKFAPIENKNNPKKEEEIIKNRKISRARTLILSVIGVLGFIIKADLVDIWFMLSLTVFLVAYSIIKQKILERGI